MGKGSMGTVRHPHVTVGRDGAAHLQLPGDADALVHDLLEALPSAHYTLHDGWRDLTVRPPDAQAAVALVTRHFPEADISNPAKPDEGSRD